MQISTKGLLFDPYSPDLVKELYKYEEFQQDISPLEKENVFKFIIFMYDMNSELRMTYPQWSERKIKCAMLSGWEADKFGEFDKTVMDMLEGRNDKVNDMITRFCLLFPSPYYAAYIAHWELLARQVKASLSYLADSKETTTIRGNIQSLTKQLEEYSDKIFGGETTIGLKNSLYRTVVKSKLRLRPEIMARDIASGELDLPDVYYQKIIPDNKGGRPRGSKDKKKRKPKTTKDAKKSGNVQV
jgi:hypothetical protein